METDNRNNVAIAEAEMEFLHAALSAIVREDETVLNFNVVRSTRARIFLLQSLKDTRSLEVRLPVDNNLPDRILDMVIAFVSANPSLRKLHVSGQLSDFSNKPACHIAAAAAKNTNLEEFRIRCMGPNFSNELKATLGRNWQPRAPALWLDSTTGQAFLDSIGDDPSFLESLSLIEYLIESQQTADCLSDRLCKILTHPKSKLRRLYLAQPNPKDMLKFLKGLELEYSKKKLKLGELLLHTTAGEDAIDTINFAQCLSNLSSLKALSVSSTGTKDAQQVEEIMYRALSKNTSLEYVRFNENECSERLQKQLEFLGWRNTLLNDALSAPPKARMIILECIPLCILMQTNWEDELKVSLIYEILSNFPGFYFPSKDISSAGNHSTVQEPPSKKQRLA